MSRRYFIAGNWKMNKTSSEAAALAQGVVEAVGNVSNVDIAICPTFTSLETVEKIIEGSNVKLGAQNMHFEKSGAFTGEISAAMLRELHCAYVILGHSERRQYFCETDQTVNKKVHAVLNAGMNPIICVGESLEQRELGVTEEHISYQLKAALSGLTASQVRRIVVAYEPIWAIGTGRTAKIGRASCRERV